MHFKKTLKKERQVKTMAKKKIGIIGGGISGAGLAYHLSLYEGEADVTVFEKDTIGGASTAKSASEFVGSCSQSHTRQTEPLSVSTRIMVASLGWFAEKNLTETRSVKRRTCPQSTKVISPICFEIGQNGARKKSISF